MTKNGKCLWIVETLLQAGALSLRELNERWERSALYDNRRIQERTFSRYKEHIANEYAIDIDYSPSTNTYDIVNREEIRDNALYRYLFAAYHIADLNTQTLRHRDRVMMEPVPTGAEHLATILDAIDRKRTVRFNYTSYYKSGIAGLGACSGLSACLRGALVPDCRIHEPATGQDLRPRAHFPTANWRDTGRPLARTSPRGVLCRMLWNYP